MNLAGKSTMSKLVSETNYSDQRFKGLDFSGQTLTETEFENCVFQKCEFVESEFKSCEFTECKFVNCRLSATKVTDSRFMNVTFIDSKVIGLDWIRASSVMFLSFDRCDISMSNFAGLELGEFSLIESVAREVNFVETVLQKSDMSGTDFELARFLKTDLRQANFIDAKNYLIDVTSNKLKGAKFKMPEAIELLDGLGVEVEW